MRRAVRASRSMLPILIAALGGCSQAPAGDPGAHADAGAVEDGRGGTPDATLDEAGDVAVDAGADATSDTGSEAAIDAGEDAASDAGSEAAVDAGQDATVDAGASPPVRGMWTSELGYTVASAPAGSPTREAFFQELAAKQMNRVILEARSMLKNDQAGLRGFVEDCHGRGLDVEVMINARRTGYTLLTSADDLSTFAGYAAAYQQAYCPSGSEAACVSAFNVDYEPHIFPEWSSDRAQAEADYLTGLSHVHAALAGRVALAAAVTNWYDGAAYEVGGETLVEAVLDAGVQRLYLMNYTDSPSQMVSRATGEVDLACGYVGGEREVISLSDAKDEGSSAADQALTFHEEGWGAMNAAWASMSAQFAARSCFRGNAGFDYDDMIALGP